MVEIVIGLRGLFKGSFIVFSNNLFVLLFIGFNMDVCKSKGCMISFMMCKSLICRD